MKLFKLMLSRGINIGRHDIEGVPSFKKLLQYVESEISMPISLVRLEDSSGLTRMFLGCCVDTRIGVYDFEELMAVIVQPHFTRLKEILGIDGDFICAPRHSIFVWCWWRDQGEGTMPHSGSLTVPISNLVVYSFTALSPRSRTFLNNM